MTTVARAAPQAPTRAPAPAPARAPAPGTSASRGAAPRPRGAPAAPGTARVSSLLPATGAAPAPAAVESVGAKLAEGEVDLSKGTLALDPTVAESVKDGGEIDVKVRLPGLAQGETKLRRRGEHFSTVRDQGILFVHPALARFNAAHPTVLVVKVNEDVVTGWVGLGMPGPVKGSSRSVFDAMTKAGELLGWVGLSQISIPAFQNKFADGVLDVKAEKLGFTVGGFLSGNGSAALDNKALSFDGSAKVQIPGGTTGELQIRKDPAGVLAGKLDLAVNIGSVAGNVTATLTQGFVSILGSVGYNGDRMSGKVTLVATDEETARDITLKKPEGGADVPIELPGPDKPVKPGKRAFCGWGQLTFRVTDWLAGTATVIINSKGQATVVGEIAPPKEFILFEQKEWVQRIFKLEIRAGYGIPVVGQVALFANISLDALATVGPGKLYKIKLTGAYSTDPRVPKQLSIEGTLNISAFAGLRLRAEAGLVVTIVAHDIKAGVGLNAIAGVRGYVEATPRIGMRELQPSKRQYYIQGHLEIAAQPILGFSGDLFVEIETPWWSPLSDKRWTWPLFSIEYPLPGEFGIGADVDYVLGSKQWPKIEFGEVDFDSSKFLSDVMNDNADSGRGGEKKKQGDWKEGPGGGAKGGAKNKGGTGKGAEGAPGEVHPIGENIAFSDGFESHNLLFEEKGTDAVLMVASGKKKVPDKLDELDREEDILRPADRSRAKGQRSKARQQAKKADEPADTTAAMNVAARNAAESARKHGKKKGTKGKKDDAKQNNKKATEAERQLAPTLKDVLHDSAKRKLDPIKRTVKMVGGTESIEIVAAGKKPALKIAGQQGDEALKKAYKHVGTAINPSAGNAIDTTIKRLLVQTKAIEAVPVVAGQVVQVAYKDLEKAATEVDKLIARLGETLKVENLARILKCPIFKPPIGVTFQVSATPNKKYHDNFKRELSAQITRQQKDLNAFNIDKWVARVDTYKSKSFEWFKGLDKEGRAAVAKEVCAKLKEAGDDQARRETDLKWVRDKLDKLTAAAPADDAALKLQIAGLKLEAQALAREQRRAKNLEPARMKVATFLDSNEALDELTPAQKKRFLELAKKAKVVGRSGEEKLWKDIHAAAIREVLAISKEEGEWSGLKVFSWEKLAPLHNPDQVAGGHGKIADITPVKKPTSRDDKKAWKAWKDYVDKVRQYVGPSWINSIIGGSWGNAIEGAKKEVVKRYPPPTFPLWMMNLALEWKQKG